MQITLVDFIKDNVTKFECYLVSTPEDADDWMKSSFAWKCLVEATNKKSKSFIFYKGSAHQGFKKLDGTYRFATQKEIREAELAKQDGRFVFKKPQAIPPTCDELLSCLVWDVQTIVSSGTFKVWCEDLDYSSDSIKAQNMYFKIQKQYDDMRELFGWDFLEKIDMETLN